MWKQVLSNVIKWLAEWIWYKIWLDFNTNNLKEVSIDNFPQLLIEILNEIEHYIAPVYNKWRQSWYNIFCKAPLYFTNLLWKYDNPRSASKHILSISLNSISSFLWMERSYFFRYITNQSVSLDKHEWEVEAYKSQSFWSQEDEKQLNLIYENLLNIVNDMRHELGKVMNIEVRSDDTSDIVKLKLDNATRQWELMFTQFIDKLEDLINSNDYNWVTDISYLWQLIEMQKTSMLCANNEMDLRNMLEKFYKTSLSMFAWNNSLLSNKFEFSNNYLYPFDTITIDWKNIDCQVSWKDLKWWDIVTKNGVLYFFEWYLQFPLEIFFVICCPIVNWKADFSQHKYFECDQDLKLKLFKRWGKYKTDDYWFNINNRNIEHTKIKKSKCDFLDNFEDLLLLRLKNILDSFKNQSKNNLSQLLWKPIIDDILKKINHPEWKQFGLKTRMMYSDRDYFSSFPIAPPPSTWNNVLRLEGSTWCNHGNCNYCELYKTSEYTVKKVDSFKRHLDLLVEFMWYPYLKDNFDRVFYTWANSLSIPTDNFKRILLYTQKKCKIQFRRIESYGTTNTIIKKAAHLEQLKDSWLSLIYWWIESCNDKVLELVNKWCTQKDIKLAWTLLRDAKIEISAMIMSWLWWIRYSDSHVDETATILWDIYPRFLTLLSVNPSPWSVYQEIIISDPENRSLNIRELESQMIKFWNRYITIAWRNPDRTYNNSKIAAYSTAINPTWINPIAFERTL